MLAARPHDADAPAPDLGGGRLLFWGVSCCRLDSRGGARLRVGLDEIQRHQHYPEHHQANNYTGVE